MAKKYLDYSGLSYFWAQIKSLWVQDVNYDSNTHQITKTKAGTTGNVVGIPYKTSDLTNDSGYITSADVPEGSSASTITPIMDGTASKGTDNGFARGDHVHPTDTSRAASSHTHGNITNAGALQTTDITIANGDKLVVTDASNSNKVARTSISFDGSTTTKVLSQKGTWVDVGDANVLEGVQMNGTDLTITSKKVNVPVFTGATRLTDGTIGLVPIPDTIQSGKTPQILASDGAWRNLKFYSNNQNRSLSLGVEGDDSVYMTITSFPLANHTSDGYMSSTDKSKLDSITMTNGVIDSSVLPSFVDDVIEAYARSNQTELGSTWLATGSASGTVITPETGKIYVLMNNSTSYDANSQFRWGSTAYVKLSDGGVSSITNSEIDTILAS